MNGIKARIADHDNQSDDEQGGAVASDQSEADGAGGLFGSGSDAEDDRSLANMRCSSTKS